MAWGTISDQCDNQEDSRGMNSEVRNSSSVPIHFSSSGMGTISYVNWLLNSMRIAAANPSGQAAWTTSSAFVRRRGPRCPPGSRHSVKRTKSDSLRPS